MHCSSSFTLGILPKREKNENNKTEEKRKKQVEKPNEKKRKN